MAPPTDLDDEDDGEPFEDDELLYPLGPRELEPWEEDVPPEDSEDDRPCEMLDSGDDNGY